MIGVIYTMNDTKIIRYVLTHVNKDGMRTLVDPMQGRYTYATKDEAQKRLDAFKPQLESTLGYHDLEVRPVEVYPVHFDPKTCWFD